MLRAILIDPGAEPTWVDLSHASNVNTAVNELIGPPDYNVIYRNPDRSGLGLHIAVGEWSAHDGSPHNDLASRLVEAFGREWHVYGRCVLMGLNGPNTVDLLDEQWEYFRSFIEPKTES
jgi:hypothetical protein